MRARPIIASVSWRRRVASGTSVRALGRSSTSRVRISASAPRVSWRNSSSRRRPSTGFVSHRSGITSAIRVVEKRVCVTASCRSRARRVRSAVTASWAAWSQALVGRVQLLGALGETMFEPATMFGLLAGQPFLGPAFFVDVLDDADHHLRGAIRRAGQRIGQTSQNTLPSLRTNRFSTRKESISPVRSWRNCWASIP